MTYMATLATLINPEGKKVVVESGSAQAQQYFGQGYTLMGAPTKPSTTTTTQTSIPAGATPISGPSGLAGLTESQIYRDPASSTIYKLPQTAIASDTINQKVEPINLGTSTPSTASADAVASSGAQSSTDLQNYITSLTPPVTKEQSEADALTARISELLPQTQGQGQALAEAEKTFGVDTLKTQLGQINTAINTGLAEYNALKTNYATAINALSSDASPYRGQGRGIPLDLVRGQEAKTRATLQFEQANTLNEKAANIGLLQAQALGVQGQITAAEEAAKKAVDLKYSAIEEELNVKQAQLKLLEPILDKQEKTLALALERQYKDQERKIADKKAETLAVYELMVNKDYAKAGVKGTDTLAQAAAKVSQYLSTSSEASSKKFGVIGSYVDENGRVVNQYGWIDETSGVITPYSVTGSQGNMNLGISTGTSFGLPMYNTANNNPGVVRAVRNNNPGNIKASDFTTKYPGVVGIESTPAQDGGNFLIFDSPASGLAAIGKLLQVGSSYKGVNAETAIRKYSGGGYGAAQVGLDPKKNFQAQIKEPSILDSVVQNIARLEGYSASLSNQESGSVPSNIQAWAERIAEGQAKLDEVPQTLRTQVNSELTKVQYQKANELKTSALESANALLKKFDEGKGTSAVGGSRLFVINPFTGRPLPGTDPSNFVIQFDNLKSLLSLDNVKYLKGQGQVSDAERRLLESASGRLNLAQSEDEFRSALADIISSLSGPASNTTQSGTTIMVGPDGTFWSVPSDKVQLFKQNGYREQ